MPEHFITKTQFRRICAERHVGNASHQQTLVQLLHDLGVVVHFDDLHLDDIHVLEPGWVTAAVYRIINAPILADNKGILTYSQVKEILNRTGKDAFCFPEDKHPYVIELMKKFELCFPVNGEEILVPSLLQKDRPDFDFDPEGGIRFQFLYEFLPPAVMPRFIVRMHRYIKEKTWWRSGVLLENKKENTEAVIKVDLSEKTIHIHVRGEQSRDFLSVIRHAVREINNSYEDIDGSERIPLPGHGHETVEYDELIGLEQIGEAYHTVGKLRKKFSVKTLLDGIETEKERKTAGGEKGGGHSIRDISANGNVTIIGDVGAHGEVKIDDGLKNAGAG